MTKDLTFYRLYSAYRILLPFFRSLHKNQSKARENKRPIHIRNQLDNIGWDGNFSFKTTPIHTYFTKVKE